MMKKPLVASLAMAVAMACSPLAMAGTTTTTSSTTTSQHANWHGKWHGHHHGHGMHMLDKLNLSATQKSSVQQLMKQNFEQAKPGMKALRQQRMAFENATPGSANYQTDASNLAQAESNAAHDRVMREADMRSKIYNILTPAQRTQLASLRSQRNEKMQQHREEWKQKHQAATSSTMSDSSTQ